MAPMTGPPPRTPCLDILYSAARGQRCPALVVMRRGSVQQRERWERRRSSREGLPRLTVLDELAGGTLPLIASLLDGASGGGASPPQPRLAALRVLARAAGKKYGRLASVFAAGGLVDDKPKPRRRAHFSEEPEVPKSISPALATTSVEDAERAVRWFYSAAAAAVGAGRLPVLRSLARAVGGGDDPPPAAGSDARDDVTPAVSETAPPAADTPAPFRPARRERVSFTMPYTRGTGVAALQESVGPAALHGGSGIAGLHAALYETAAEMPVPPPLHAPTTTATPPADDDAPHQDAPVAASPAPTPPSTTPEPSHLPYSRGSGLHLLSIAEGAAELEGVAALHAAAVAAPREARDSPSDERDAPPASASAADTASEPPPGTAAERKEEVGVKAEVQSSAAKEAGEGDSPAPSPAPASPSSPHAPYARGQGLALLCDGAAGVALLCAAAAAPAPPPPTEPDALNTAREESPSFVASPPTPPLSVTDDGDVMSEGKHPSAAASRTASNATVERKPSLRNAVPAARVPVLAMLEEIVDEEVVRTPRPESEDEDVGRDDDADVEGYSEDTAEETPQPRAEDQPAAPPPADPTPSPSPTAAPQQQRQQGKSVRPKPPQKGGTTRGGAAASARRTRPAFATAANATGSGSSTSPKAWVVGGRPQAAKDSSNNDAARRRSSLAILLDSHDGLLGLAAVEEAGVPSPTQPEPRPPPPSTAWYEPRRPVRVKDCTLAPGVREVLKAPQKNVMRGNVLAAMRVMATTDLTQYGGLGHGAYGGHNPAAEYAHKRNLKKRVKQKQRQGTMGFHHSTLDNIHDLQQGGEAANPAFLRPAKPLRAASAGGRKLRPQPPLPRLGDAAATATALRTLHPAPHHLGIRLLCGVAEGKGSGGGARGGASTLTPHPPAAKPPPTYAHLLSPVRARRAPPHGTRKEDAYLRRSGIVKPVAVAAVHAKGWQDTTADTRPLLMKLRAVEPDYMAVNKVGQGQAPPPPPGKMGAQRRRGSVNSAANSRAPSRERRGSRTPRRASMLPEIPKQGGKKAAGGGATTADTKRSSQGHAVERGRADSRREAPRQQSASASSTVSSVSSVASSSIPSKSSASHTASTPRALAAATPLLPPLPHAPEPLAAKPAVHTDSADADAASISEDDVAAAVGRTSPASSSSYSASARSTSRSSRGASAQQAAAAAAEGYDSETVSDGYSEGEFV